MPELRTDWLSGRTVIVAEERAARPNEFGGPVIRHSAERNDLPEAASPACPFCPGQEHRTPHATYEMLDASNRWRVRVVPNLYPAVSLSADHDSTPSGPAAVHVAFPAAGAHEVIVESPRHVGRTSALSTAELRDVLLAYAERLRYWRDDGRWRYALVFKNQGQRAGASLVHLHSQLVALPSVPMAVVAELRRAELDATQSASCPYCRLIRQERTTGTRLVADRDGFVAFCPFASWQPHEVWLLPEAHEPWFEQISPAAIDRLAGVLGELVGRVEAIVPESSYNLLVRTAPWVDGVSPWCHWRIEILPRAAALAGLELAAGIHINPLAPEHAARHLRTA